jgi:hypothetical protein
MTIYVIPLAFGVLFGLIGLVTSGGLICMVVSHVKEPKKWHWTNSWEGWGLAIVFGGVLGIAILLSFGMSIAFFVAGFGG